jgi:hypothetical protein
MDRATILERLDMVRRHIVEGERLVARQRKIVAGLKGGGDDADCARRLLGNLRELQQLHIADRDQLETQLADSSE